MARLLVSVTTAILGLTALLGAQPAHDFLSRPVSASIRVVTWNIYRSSIFPPEGEEVDLNGATRPARFARVVRALHPDVVCLQEVTVDVARSAGLLDSILPLPDGHAWQAFAAEDTVIVSRFDLAARAEGHVEGERRRGHAMALIKTPATDLLVICAHFQSEAGGEDIALRREQAGLIANTIREAKAGGGPIPLRTRTPFMILGDLNAIAGATTFLETLVNGRMGGASATRPGEGLDWDRSALVDALPRHNAAGAERYTWRNDLERYQPGILDRIIYSDSVLSSVHQFVLDTTTMSHHDLFGAGLRPIDVMRDPLVGIHDHFPLVIDVVARPERRQPRAGLP
jgi:endonuclease/exonuclease/phosphatase family metal-dependent hydrolase